MPIDTATPWHKASFDHLLGERLPGLLAERLPLAGYRVEPAGPYTCRLTVTIATDAGTRRARSRSARKTTAPRRTQTRATSRSA